MANPTPMLYDNDTSDVYRNWVTYGLNCIMADQTNLQYFGDLKGKTAVEFGCGVGRFSRILVEKGAAFVLALDLNESMIVSGGNKISHKLERIDGQPCFMTQNSCQPLDKDYGQFDFALGQFILYDFKTETELEIFLKNVIDILKPGGKLFISQNPFFPNNLKDQEIMVNLCGIQQPLRKTDPNGKEPVYADVPTFRQAPPPVSKTGRPFTRDRLFTFNDYYWTKEKVMKSMDRVGFVHITLLPPAFPDDVPEFERKQVASLEEPFIFVGAEKPKA